MRARLLGAEVQRLNLEARRGALDAERFPQRWARWDGDVEQTDTVVERSANSVWWRPWEGMGP